MKKKEFPSKVFHIALANEWNQGLQDGAYRTGSLDIEGFIHFSTGKQLLRTANKFFQGKHDLVLLVIEPEKLAAELRYEPIENGQLFPHLYGLLNLDAVTSVLRFAPDMDGTFSWPVDLHENAGEI